MKTRVKVASIGNSRLTIRDPNFVTHPREKEKREKEKKRERKKKDYLDTRSQMSMKNLRSQEKKGMQKQWS